MYTLLLLACFQAAFVTASSLSGAIGLGEPHTLEEPPHVLAMDMSPDSPSKQNFLTTRQKKVLFHPKIQEMLMNKLNRDMMAYESDRDERDIVPKMVPPGFVSPRVLAEWGIDWDEMAREEEYDSGNDTEKSLVSLRMEDKENGNQKLGKSDSNVWSLSYWHPTALVGHSEYEGDEE